MKENKYGKELFIQFQEMKDIFQDVLYFKVEKPLHRTEPIGLDFFSFLLFECASGSHTIDFVQHNITNKQLHFLFPDQLHSWNIEGEVKIHTIFVSRKLFRTFENFLVFPIDYYKKNPVINLSDKAFHQILTEFKGIDAELMASNGIQEIIYSRFRMISLMLSRDSFEETENETPSLFLLKKFSLQVLTDWKEKRTVGGYAQKLGITANYLNILCRKHLHMTASDVIQKQVLNHIKNELIHSTKSVKEIAIEMNFREISLFSNFFKRHVGMSPSRFQLNMRLEHHK